MIAQRILPDDIFWQRMDRIQGDPFRFDIFPDLLRDVHCSNANRPALRHKVFTDFANVYHRPMIPVEVITCKQKILRHKIYLTFHITGE
ncbi:hypothetical protein SDC9_175730 [bioreactor metagenome]|uniref:Uncharacterized protein n=1 Tax=bioreactor metagenome TaxID=1076179 RepID=A0A645GQX2_9ZZZZ